MQVTTIDEGEDGQVAINLDLVVHARFYRGKERSLILHFAGDEKNKMAVQQPHAEKVWAALTKNI